MGIGCKWELGGDLRYATPEFGRHRDKASVWAPRVIPDPNSVIHHIPLPTGSAVPLGTLAHAVLSAVLFANTLRP